MEIPSKRVLWNEHEAALLIKVYENVQSGILSRFDAITQLSEQLRNSIIKDDVTINEKYKNIAGIDLQLNTIERYMSDRTDNSEKVSIAKTFEKIILIKQDQPYRYNQILSEANLLYPMVKETINYNIPQKAADVKIKAILVDHFKFGYRIGSNMDRKRFAIFYAQKFGNDLAIESTELDEEIVKCGIICAGNKLYVPEAMLDETTKNDLFEYISKLFDKNLKYIYYNRLFEEFSDKFFGQKILDDAMLHAYLEFYYVDDKYKFGSQYFSKDSEVALNIDKKVIDFIKEQGGNVYEEEVISAFSFIPEETIHESFNGNKSILLTSGRGKRFHVSNFQFELDDKQSIINYLTQEIKDMKFVSFLELVDKMKIIAPRVVDNNIQFSETGIRSALSILLGDLFYFRGGIISDIKHPISLQDAFVDFARGRDSFTVEEVQMMADDFGTLINFEALAVHNIRICDSQYVSKDCISFDVNTIDDVIAMFCKGDFISISDILTFVAFPECGYKWNEYLLESYLYDFSSRFRLFHNRFNKTSVSGAIVRKNAQFNDYNEVLTRALVDASILLEKRTDVLSFFAESGYIGRRQLDSIDQVIYRAKQLITN